MNSKLKTASWVTAGIFVGAMATVQLQAIARDNISPLPLEQIQEFAAVYGIIKTAYVEPTKDNKLVQDAIAGMVAGLDPHSQYLNAEDFKELRESTSGKFVGVGIEITQEDGLVKIVSPIEGSPAYRAGLQTGDLITRIDDTEVQGLSLQQAVQRMRGEPNTRVILRIFRKSENKSFTVNITREEIHTQSVKAHMAAPGYGWIRISQFQENTVETFVSKLNDLYRENPDMKGLVLDLRNDPGGLLDAAIAISTAFLPADAVVVSTDGQLADSKFVFKASPQYYLRFGANDPLKTLSPKVKTVPLVVLVNEGSASASEIVAGALQDHKRAIIMGARTFGKGSVQTIRPLSADTAIKLTTALYYTPSKRSIQATGIQPDILLAENADGSSPLSALYLREADLDRHLVVNKEDKNSTTQRLSQRDEAIKQLEEKKKDDKLPPPTQLGSKDDFRLQQALNYLQGKPVVIAKAQAEKDQAKDNENKEGAQASTVEDKADSTQDKPQPIDN